MKDELAARWVPFASVKPWAKNPKKNDASVERIMALLIRFGWGRTLLAREENGELIAGHATRRAVEALIARYPQLSEAERKGWHPEAVRTALEGVVPVRFKSMSAEEAHELAVADNRSAEWSSWDEPLLYEQLGGYEPDERLLLGFSDEDFKALLPETGKGGSAEGLKLTDSYGEPPFSVLDTRSGRWQERRRAWLDLGIKSEIGRGGNMWGFSETVLRHGEKIKRKDRAFGPEGSVKKRDGETDEGWTGTSVFDPVLCELSYSWFSPVGGKVLDPFAGGSVRGIVAAVLGRYYLGIDLRKEQVEANRVQWKEIKKVFTEGRDPKWIEGDSAAELSKVKALSVDFLFSCPPYMDLEVYSDDKRDISHMDPEGFRSSYFEIIKQAASKLKDDRFAVFVVSEVREKTPLGAYRRLPQMTVEAFESAGLRYYNDVILLNSVGSLPIRVRKQFESGRKLGRVHQNVLVFCKGDPKKAALACGKPERADFSKASASAAEFGEEL